MASCQGCDATVFWRKNDKTGKSAPVDASPVPDGNVVLSGPDTYHVLTKAEKFELARAADQMFPPPIPDRYTLHFATCPNASHFRRDHVAHRDKTRPR